MKKTLILTLFIAVSFSMMACGGGELAAETAAEPASSVSVEEEVNGTTYETEHFRFTIPDSWDQMSEGIFETSSQNSILIFLSDSDFSYTDSPIDTSLLTSISAQLGIFDEDYVATSASIHEIREFTIRDVSASVTFLGSSYNATEYGIADSDGMASFLLFLHSVGGSDSDAIVDMVDIVYSVERID